MEREFDGMMYWVASSMSTSLSLEPDRRFVSPSGRSYEGAGHGDDQEFVCPSGPSRVWDAAESPAALCPSGAASLDPQAPSPQNGGVQDCPIPPLGRLAEPGLARGPVYAEGPCPPTEHRGA